MKEISKIILSLRLISVLFTTSHLQADTTYVSGHITSDTTWTEAGSPYIVTGDVSVDSGITLTIQGRVEVEFMPNQDDQHSGVDTGRCELIIKGRIIAKGGIVNAETLRVVFTSADTLPMRADWGWINFVTVDTSCFEYCIVEYGVAGIYTVNSYITIKNSTFRYNLWGGIWVHESNLKIDSCKVVENYAKEPYPVKPIPSSMNLGRFGLIVSKSVSNITNCLIANNMGGIWYANCLPRVCFQNKIEGNETTNFCLRLPEDVNAPITVPISQNTISDTYIGLSIVNLYENRDYPITIRLIGNTIVNNEVGLWWTGIKEDTLLSLVATYNIIKYNASVGIYIEEEFGTVNFGNLTNPDTTDDGHNIISHNHIYNFLNRTSEVIMAQGNYWWIWDPDSIDATIYDDDEEPWRGKVIFGVSGGIEDDIIWKNKGVIVTGDVTITPPSTLTLSPGISLYFSGWDELNSGVDPNRCEFTVNGTLIAKGLDADSIRFTSGLGNPGPGDWYGIVFKSAKSKGNPDEHWDSRLRTLLPQRVKEINDEEIERRVQLLEEKCAEFERLIVEYAKSGISFKRDGIFKLKNSEIRDCSDGGIRTDALFQFSIIDSVKVNSTHRGILPRSPTWILNSEVSDCDSVGISTTGVGGVVYKCNVTNNKIGIRAKHISMVVINHTDIVNNSKYGVYIDEDARPNLGIVAGFNKIYGSSEFDVYNNTDNDIFAKYNYWGTMNLDTIRAHIWDYYDNPTLGKVIFQPIWDGTKASGEDSMCEKDGIRIHNFNLFQNSSNPFIEKTVIYYTIPEKERVSLNIYDAIGRLVQILVDKEVEPGYYEVNWDAENLVSGVYFAKFVAGDYKATRKLILAR